MTNRMTGQDTFRTTPSGDPNHVWTLLELTRLVVRHWRTMAVVCAAAMTVTAIIMVFTPNYYVSSASILPSGKVDNMSALKEAVGISSSANMDENSSALFPVVLRSRIVADSVLARTYVVEADGRSMRVDPVEYLGATDLDELRQVLSGATAITVAKKTGDIHIAVETRYPWLSQALVQAYIEELEDFNMNRRKSVGHLNARYLAAQVEKARTALQTAEDSLADFRRHNADWAGSTNAEVVADLTRLQREVEVKTSTYVYLQQQLEMARIDEQKDVPIVRILDTPSLPTLKSRPQRLLSVLLAGLTAVLLTTLFLLVREHLRRESAGSAAVALAGLKADIGQHIPGASRMLKIRAKPQRTETVTEGRE